MRAILKLPIQGTYAIKVIGVMLMFVSFVLVFPLIILPFYRNEINYIFCFIIPALIAGVLGLVLSRIPVTDNERLSLGSDAVIVVVIWILAVFFSALPFMLAGMLNFTQAYFEAMSGWTTTGLSVVNVAEAPKLFLFFRSVIQFFGGVGIVLVVVSALSETFGMGLYTAEGHNDKLLPNLAKSARTILKIYVGYFVAGTALYVIFGMSVFDAVNHSMASLSTGGFSTQPASIGAYNSFAIELTTIVLMLLGQTNFFANLLLVRRRFRAFFRLGETKVTFLILGISVPLVAVVSLVGVYGNLSSALRISLFNLASALTTTGYATVDYRTWPSFAWIVMIVLMIIGGGAGSTAGGIKVGRLYLLCKQIGWNIRRKFLPERMVNQPVLYRPEGKTFISQELYAESANYGFMFIGLYFVGTAILAACGYSLQDSMFEFASALGTVGISIGLTSVNTSPVALWTMTWGMFLGRLEIFVVFYAVVKVARSLKVAAVKGV